jgi:hypothetical protein
VRDITFFFSQKKLIAFGGHIYSTSCQNVSQIVVNLRRMLLVVFTFTAKNPFNLILFPEVSPSRTHAARGPYLQTRTVSRDDRKVLGSLLFQYAAQFSAMQRSAFLIKILLTVLNVSVGNYSKSEMLLCLAERRVCVLSYSNMVLKCVMMRVTHLC